MIKNKELLKTAGYINGKWVKGRKTFPVLNPFNQKEICKVADLGKKEAIAAVKAAQEAFPLWSALPAPEREQKIKKLVQLIQAHSADLATLLTTEQGKPLPQAQGEVAWGADLIQWVAEEGCRIHGYTQPDPDKDRQVITFRQPIGVVAVITPWNFPFLLTARMAFAAIAAGCTVVHKPAEDTPLNALALAYLAQEAGIPKGVLNVVPCQNPIGVGSVLTTHPFVKKVTFTGSTEVGKKIAAQSASTVKKVALELGGNCPFIVFEDADIKKALDSLFALKFLNAGQCCSGVNRIFVHKKIYDTFIDQFTKRAKKLTVGSGLQSPDIGPLINCAAKDKVDHLVKDAIKHGAEIALASTGHGLVCSPIVIKHANKKMRIWKEEIFGPVAAFYVFHSEKEAIEMANDTNYGLAAYFFTEGLGRAMRVSRALEAGSVGINTTDHYLKSAPFGGWKESGLGREGGIVETLNEYCELKAVHIRKT
jgi:succinate-semialdehyde dehydrogenase/glutarate-semialdehyde dehydrogenase